MILSKVFRQTFKSEVNFFLSQDYLYYYYNLIYYAILKTTVMKLLNN